MPHLLQILLLAIVQGLAELLPVSSSAHVTVVARLMKFPTTSNFEWAFMLIMLHTGTMFAVLLYFWPRWKALIKSLPVLIAATACTGGLFLAISKFIEYFFLQGEKIESLFRNFPVIAVCLAVVGVFIVAAGMKERRSPGNIEGLSWVHGIIIGLVQGLCLPFRGLSRSGSTISAGLFLGINRMRAEEYSFALAVLLTPAAIAYEGYHVYKQYREPVTATAATNDSSRSGPNAKSVADKNATAPSNQPNRLMEMLPESLFGMCLSFAAGLVALRWLSRWLEQGHWSWFGYYCLAAAAIVLTLHFTLPPA